VLDCDEKSFYRLPKASFPLLSDVKAGGMNLSVPLGNWSLTMKMQPFADLHHRFLLLITSFISVYTFFFNGSSSPFRALAFYSVPKTFFTVGRTAWTSDQLVARPLPKHRTTQTQNKRIHTANIHALNGIQTQVSSV
jgi:hypothetical protein